jgi:hypothetical protein
MIITTMYYIWHIYALVGILIKRIRNIIQSKIISLRGPVLTKMAGYVYMQCIISAYNLCVVEGRRSYDHMVVTSWIYLCNLCLLPLKLWVWIRCHNPFIIENNTDAGSCIPKNLANGHCKKKNHVKLKQKFLKTILDLHWFVISETSGLWHLQNNTTLFENLSPSTPVSSTNKNDRHNFNEILLRVALNTITPNHPIFFCLLTLNNDIPFHRTVAHQCCLF